MKIKGISLALLATALGNTAFAAEGSVPKGISDLNHVFFIMMENHGYGQIVNNPNAPFINQLAKSANYATNYFAIGHPSSTNYLEVMGGSNFGVRSDDYPNWHSTCAPNLATGITTFDTPASVPALVCPIWGSGIDAATPAIDCTNEVTAPPCLLNIDGTKSIAAASNTVGKTRISAPEMCRISHSFRRISAMISMGGATQAHSATLMRTTTAHRPA